jgi:hypothetical protein
MLLYSWLRRLRSTLAPDRGRRHHKGRGSLRAATHRPSLEVLEDRLTPSFSPATSFPVGPNPQVVVTADFNNDGHLDLATTNAGGNTVSVLLSGGRGGFGAANHFATGTGPRSMAVGDFNNDGNLDLVTVSDQVAGASTMLGNGDGTFRAPKNHFTWGGPQAVAVGNFNADDSMDIVVSEFDDQDGFGKVQMLLGNGQDGFTAANAYTLDFFLASGLAVSDLNGDGKLDAAVVVPSEWAGVGYAVLGNGDGTFGPAYFGGQEFVTGLDSRAVAAGDFTGDGMPDLVVAGQTVDVLRGHGDGWFDDPISHSANGNMHTGVAVGEFNGPGIHTVLRQPLKEVIQSMPRIVTTVHDPVALAATCRQLRLAPPREGSVRHGTEEVSGWVVRLPGVRFPIACDTVSGLVAYHPLDGARQHYQHIMRFILRYYDTQFHLRRTVPAEGGRRD